MRENLETTICFPTMSLAFMCLQIFRSMLPSCLQCHFISFLFYVPLSSPLSSPLSFHIFLSVLTISLSLSLSLSLSFCFSLAFLLSIFFSSSFMTLSPFLYISMVLPFSGTMSSDILFVSLFNIHFNVLVLVLDLDRFRFFSFFLFSYPEYICRLPLTLTGTIFMKHSAYQASCLLVS